MIIKIRYEDSDLPSHPPSNLLSLYLCLFNILISCWKLWHKNVTLYVIHEYSYPYPAIPIPQVIMLGAFSSVSKWGMNSILLRCLLSSQTILTNILLGRRVGGFPPPSYSALRLLAKPHVFLPNFPLFLPTISINTFAILIIRKNSLVVPNQQVLPIQMPNLKMPPLQKNNWKVHPSWKTCHLLLPSWKMFNLQMP